MMADAKDMPRALVEVMHDLTWKSEGVSESLIARVRLNGRLKGNPDVSRQLAVSIEVCLEHLYHAQGQLSVK